MSDNGTKVIEAIRRTAAERFDHVYLENCVYVKTLVDPEFEGGVGYQPGCLVGHGLVEAGLISDMREFAQIDENAISFAKLAALHPEWEFDDEEIFWILTTQDRQDAEKRWGIAVRIADNPYEWYGKSNREQWENQLKVYRTVVEKERAQV
jgi:hypothetical protein